MVTESLPERNKELYYSAFPNKTFLISLNSYYVHFKYYLIYMIDKHNLFVIDLYSNQTFHCLYLLAKIALCIVARQLNTPVFAFLAPCLNQFLSADILNNEKFACYKAKRKEVE